MCLFIDHQRSTVTAQTKSREGCGDVNAQLVLKQGHDAGITMIHSDQGVYGGIKHRTFRVSGGPSMFANGHGFFSHANSSDVADRANLGIDLYFGRYFADSRVDAVWFLAAQPDTNKAMKR